MFFVYSYHCNIVCGFFNDHPIRTVKRYSFLFYQGPVFGFYMVAETHARHSTLNQKRYIAVGYRWLFSYLSCDSFNSIFHMIFIPFLSVGILRNAWILHRTRKLEFIIDENLGFIFVSTQSIMKFNVFFIGGKTRIFRIEFLWQWL